MSVVHKECVLVAEIGRDETDHLVRTLKSLSQVARVALSSEQILDLLRAEVFQRAIVAAELNIGGETALAYFSRLLAVKHLIAVGPAHDTSLEMQARCSGANAYLVRPVSSEALAKALWIQSCNSPGEDRSWSQLRFAGVN